MTVRTRVTASTAVAATLAASIALALTTTVAGATAAAAVEDTAPPHVFTEPIAPTASPATVVAGAADTRVAVRMYLGEKDVNPASTFTARPPAGAGEPFTMTWTSGAGFYAEYKGEWKIPSSTPPGTYGLSFTDICDTLGNCHPASTWPGTTVTLTDPSSPAPAPSPVLDRTAPSASSGPRYTSSPVALANGQPGRAEVRIRFVDDSSGLASDLITVRPAVGAGQPFLLTRVSGTDLNGEYAGIWNVPADTAAGGYVLTFENVCDRAGNCTGSSHWPSDEWQLQVVRPTAPATSPTPTATPTGTPAASPSATPTGTPTTPATTSPVPRPLVPSPDDPETEVAPQVHLGKTIISAGEEVSVSYSGTPGTTLSVQSRTQPASMFSHIRSVDLVLDPGGQGTATTTHRPMRNTRMLAVTASGVRSNEPLIQVRSVASLTARKVSGRTYTFTGKVFPAREQRLVSIYRNGVLAAQGRTNASGVYTISKLLPVGTYGYQARTADDTYNLGASSPVARIAVAAAIAPAPAPAPAPASTARTFRVADGADAPDRQGDIGTVSVTVDRAARKVKFAVPYYARPNDFYFAEVGLGFWTGNSCDTTRSTTPSYLFHAWNSGSASRLFGPSLTASVAAGTSSATYTLSGPALANSFTCAVVETGFFSEYRYHWDDDCSCVTRITRWDEAVVRLS